MATVLRVSDHWPSFTQALELVSSEDPASITRQAIELIVKACEDLRDSHAEAINAVPPAFKSYPFTSQGIGSGTYYVAGFYEAVAADANLSGGSTTVTLGAANVPYAAHVFVVMGGAGGGSLTVTGTSITDLGVRTTSDTETVVSDLSAVAVDEYYETAKKFLGQVTITLVSPGTADFNYGWAKYEDYGNRDFTLTDFECVGLAAANDASFDIALLKHDDQGWTYDAAAFVPGGTEIKRMSTVHSTESDVDSSVPFAFKLTELATAVTGSASEGILVEVTTGQPNTVQMMAVHCGAEFLV